MSDSTYTRIDDIHINSTTVVKNKGHIYNITFEAAPISARYRILMFSDVLKPPELQLTDNATLGSFQFNANLDGEGLFVPEGEYRLILENLYTASNRAYGDSFNLTSKEPTDSVQVASSSPVPTSMGTNPNFLSIFQQSTSIPIPSNTDTDPAANTSNPAPLPNTGSNTAQAASSGLSGGAKAGMAIGAILGLLIASMGAFWLGKRRNTMRTSSQEDQILSWGKHEIDGNEVMKETTIFTELDAERPLQELPHFHHNPVELPASFPGYRGSSALSSAVGMPKVTDPTHLCLLEHGQCGPFSALNALTSIAIPCLWWLVA